MPEQNERPYPPRRRRRRRRRRVNYTAIIFWLAVVLVLVGIVAAVLTLSKPGPGDETTGPSGTTAPTTAPTTQPTTEPTTESTGPTDPPPVTKVTTATVGATGDMVMHMPCVEPALNTTTGVYDFQPYFRYMQDYVNAVDYAVANLETTLAGGDYVHSDGKVGYRGYPSFNCPDEIVTSLQSSGFDMLLTANNHTYDTGSGGFHRTQQVIQNAGMDYTGTIGSTDTANYLIRDINGVKIGMICYTFETNPDPDKIALNWGATMRETDAPLINTFFVDDLAPFYDEMEDNVAAMKGDGAEAIVLFIHWGAEYQLKPNSSQKNIAQEMCNRGVDVIVGSHPHVIQPVDLLTSNTDPEHKTVCLYSTGNCLSNQRLGLISSISTAHTEDGVFFSFSFAKYSDGTVRLEDVKLLPLWVNKHKNSATGKNTYDIIPLDKQIEDWKAQFDLTSSTLSQAENSYDRTMALVGEGMQKIQQYLKNLPEII